MNKAIATARTLRPLIPSYQHIRAVPTDVSRLTHRQLCGELRDISVAAITAGDVNVGAQGNLAGRDMAIPVVTPGMFPEGDQIIADLHITRWDRLPLTAGCLDCLRPPRPGQPSTLDAQRATAAEVIAVASITASAIVGILAPDSIYGQWVERQMAQSATYHIIHRWPLLMEAVRNLRRPGCPVCVPEQPHFARVERPSTLSQISRFVHRLSE